MACLQLHGSLKINEVFGTETESLQFLRAYSVVNVRLQSFREELDRYTADIVGKQCLYRLAANLPTEILLAFGFPWCSAGDHFEEDHTKCPDITFEAVFVIGQGFWWHVQR